MRYVLRCAIRMRSAGQQGAMSGTKPGRNDPCWCRSGKKYKRCHLDEDAGKPFDFSDLMAMVTARVRGRPKTCLHPDAGGTRTRIVSAHTISLTRTMALVAEQGHVLSFRPDLVGARQGGPLLVPERLISNGPISQTRSASWLQGTPPSATSSGLRKLLSTSYGRVPTAEAIAFAFGGVSIVRPVS